MWLCLNDAFLSIVFKEGEKDEFCVRGRRKDHITNVFPDAEVKEGLGTDYKYRAFIKKEEVVKVVAERMMNIDYGNFKNSVKDHALHDAYLGIWSEMHQLQR